mgnify:CR=1 FL=1
MLWPKELEILVLGMMCKKLYEECEYRIYEIRLLCQINVFGLHLRYRTIVRNLKFKYEN